MVSYMLNIYHTLNYRSEIEQFLNSKKIYMLVPEEEEESKSFIYNIYEMIQNRVYDYYRDNDFDDKCEFQYFVNKNNCLRDCLYSVPLTPETFITTLIKHKDFGIISGIRDDSNWWIYIQFIETSSKTHLYTLEEINDFIQTAI